MKLYDIVKAADLNKESFVGSIEKVKIYCWRNRLYLLDEVDSESYKVYYDLNQVLLDRKRRVQDG